MRSLNASEVKAKNYNIPKGGVKPDIKVEKNGISYFIDVGFSNDADAYYKFKKGKYSMIND
jgi:hypothetical protein